MLRIVNTVLILGFFCSSWAQDKVTLSGYIHDASNGETLIGATVFIDELKTGTVSNEYGFYSVSVDPGIYHMRYSYLGYDTYELLIDLTTYKKQIVELVPEGYQLEEVVISADADNMNVSNVEMSVNSLEMQTIKKMPTLLGEVEVLRSIQLLPGVSSVGEGASGFNVRGGSIDQNLVLLDEAPVYNSSHLFGFFSVFNPDAIKDVKLLKGGIPSRYGGRLSSILDVRMKEGNNKNLSVKGGVGAIFSRLSVEAPILKDKASFIVAGRRSYIDILAAPFLNDELADSRLNFYDLTAKVNYKIDESNRVFLSSYFGRDNFGFGNQAGFNWGNSTLTLRWNHLFSDKLFSNFTVYTSDYDYQIDFGDDAINNFTWDARIVNYSIKPEMSWFVNPQNLIRFGGQGIFYRFEPGNAVGVSEGVAHDLSVDDKFALEGALFIENKIDLSSSIAINYGLRWSYFNYIGAGRSYTFGEAPRGLRRPVLSSTTYEQWESIQTYSNLEPRISMKFQLSEDKSVKASYNRMAQYIHLISNTTASTPVDIWTPSTNNLKPQIADQWAVGYFQNLNQNTYEFSAELYYKQYAQLLDYIDGADLLLNEFLDGDLLEGKGRSYGVELMLKKSKGRFSGWASYTIARTERLVEGINNNEWYPSRYDQTHNLSLTGFYELADRWSLSSNFVLISGTPATFPTTRFEQQGYIIPYNLNETRNNVRIPVYHRLDISATLQGKKNLERRWQSEWVFSIYNIYSRRNPFSIYFKQGENTTTEAIRLSVIGNFIPSVSYNFKF